jgi:rhodanese-related sulfurtransferase
MLKFICAWLLIISAAHAADSIVPDNIPGVATLNAEQLIELVVETPDLIIIDSRITANRKYGYIDGSLSLPDTETNCDSLAARVPALENQIVFYCNGVKCGRSVNAIEVAQACGYENLSWFRGGFQEWSDKGYPFLKQ